MEIAVVRAWIASVLQADSVVQSKIGNKFYAGAATVKAGDFYVVYSSAAPGYPAKKIGRRNNNSFQFLYDIVVYQKGSGNAEFTDLVKKVGELFSDQSNVVYRGYCLSSYQENQLDKPENDKDKDTQWSCLGGTYRILINKI